MMDAADGEVPVQSPSLALMTLRMHATEGSAAGLGVPPELSTLEDFKQSSSHHQ